MYKNVEDKRACALRHYYRNRKRLNKARMKYKMTYDPVKRAKWHRARMDKINWFLSFYKIHHGCKDCGYNKNAAALDLDHVDRSRKRKDPTLFESFRQIARELPNLEVRCANCHRIKTYENKDYLNVSNTRRNFDS